MTTTAASSPEETTVPRFSVAGAFLEGLAVRDFNHLGSALSGEVHLRDLVPPGPKEWESVDEGTGAFSRWFGDAERFELVDAVVGEVGPRLHLRWRVRLQAERLGAGWFVVEQQAYADTDETDQITHLSLLCSGYCPERGDG